MINMRASVPADVPRQRELWKLAFGDDGAYVDNFYHNYYRPERVVVLGEVTLNYCWQQGTSTATVFKKVGPNRVRVSGYFEV